MKVAIPNSLF